mmetsp:Transcript_5645/g.12381  ORF Transcript_5645/g.12381 Transcript_5645/m.12381 type:complete len:207 (-) Transcript_5645:1166-1786(-)
MEDDIGDTAHSAEESLYSRKFSHSTPPRGTTAPGPGGVGASRPASAGRTILRRTAAITPRGRAPIPGPRILAPPGRSSPTPRSGDPASPTGQPRGGPGSGGGTPRPRRRTGRRQSPRPGRRTSRPSGTRGSRRSAPRASQLAGASTSTACSTTATRRRTSTRCTTTPRQSVLRPTVRALGTTIPRSSTLARRGSPSCGTRRRQSSG